MCELFAMSSKQPATVNYSLDEFAKHGGGTYSNRAGWGIVFYEEGDARVIREPLPASDSPWVTFVREQELNSDCVIAHVRLANVGGPMLKNTHPFSRELGGRVHAFAHNGELKGLHNEVDLNALTFRPIGETDSELAFCLLMERLKPLWLAPQAPSVEARLGVFAEFANDMARRGAANFLYADGDTLFVHAHRRIYEKDGQFSEPKPPGLSLRNCLACTSEPEYSVSGLKVDLTEHQVTLVASVPLDDSGDWVALPEGCALALQRGVEIARVTTA